MKTKYHFGKSNFICLFLSFLALTSCSDFTDIKPKGKNLLMTVDELELLLNVQTSFYSSINDMRTVGGDAIFGTSNIANLLSKPSKDRVTYFYGYLDSEEDIKQIETLTENDSFYDDCYSWIGKTANPILSQLSIAEGPESKKAQLKAEALTLRAYAHYLVLQKFAKAYDPFTAAEDGGIIYLTENCNIQDPQPQKSVKKCYEMALNDINEAIDINALPSEAIAKTRFNKAAAYAVKAHICMSMGNYEEAEKSAKAALSENGLLYDYHAHKNSFNSPVGIPYEVSTIAGINNPEAYYLINLYINFVWITPSMWNAIEEGYATRDLFPTFRTLYAGTPNADIGMAFGLSGWNSGFDQTTHFSASALDTPHMYLICAETALRSGDISTSMGYLDQLRKNRLSSEGFTPFKGSVTTKEEAIAKIKITSFAENLWGVWNFIDRKRWNTEKDWETTLSRTFGGITYTLSPKSNLWVFPFPLNVRVANPNITSNRNN